MKSYPLLNQITPQDEAIFKEYYFHKKPVIIRGYFSGCQAVKKWNIEYFQKKYGSSQIKVYKGPTSCPEKYVMSLRDYTDFLETNEERKNELSGDEKQLYLFNFQLMKLGKSIFDDIDVNPGFLLGKWYHKNWKRDLFFFFGNKHSKTRLHYDSLGTHNTFFQVTGKKKFILGNYSESDKCYLNFPCNTFSPVNPENPDFEKYPLFKKANLFQTTLEPGDVLYMPPYTLHYVRGLQLNMSFNIDWHDKKSVREAFTLRRVRGLLCHYWNFITFLGVSCSIPNDWLYPLYKSQYR